MGVIVCDDRRFEFFVDLDILGNFDDGFRAQSVPDGISPRPVFALLGVGTCASDGVASVGLDLSERAHGLARPLELRSAPWAGSSVVLDCLVTTAVSFGGSA